MENTKLASDLIALKNGMIDFFSELKEERNYNYKMSELDFIFFGIEPDNQNLKQRICEALTESIGIEFSPSNSATEVIDAYCKRKRFRKLEPTEKTIIESEWLLVCYLYMWRARKSPRHLFQSGAMAKAMKEITELRSEIESISTTSKLYPIVLDIFQEYETYSFQWEETRKHIKKQRNILSGAKTRKKFVNEIEKRDGIGCKICGLTENLHIDHIKPVTLGGFSILDNLQLLCAPCNYKKERERQLEFSRRKVIS